MSSELNEGLRFSLLNPTGHFGIGTTSGVVRTTGVPFDREVKDHYEVVVQARGKGGRVARALIQVEVLDVNDNAPTFVNVPYHAVVARSVPINSIYYDGFFGKIKSWISLEGKSTNPHRVG